MSRRSHLLRLCSLLLVMTLLFTACTRVVSPPPPPPATPRSTPAARSATPMITPTPVALEATLRDENGGFSLSYPRNWYTRELTGTWALAPSEAALNADTVTSEMVVFIDSTAVSDIADQHGEQVVADAQSFFDFISARPRAEGFVLSEPVSITVDETPGVLVDLRADGGVGQLVTFLGPSHAVRVLAQSLPDTWVDQKPILTAMIDSLSFFEPAPPATPVVVEQAMQPSRITNGPEGFVLRIGGNTGPRGGRFAAARGLAVGSDGTIYLAESSRGIWAFAPDGTLVRTFGKEDVLDAYDIAINQEGDLFVADYGRNAIARFQADGTFVGQWGATGDEPGQFGLSAPQRIAIGPDGSIYALDSRMTADGSGVVSSVVRFNSADGSLIERIDLPSGSTPNDLAVDAQGNIYLAEPFSKSIVKLNSAGQEVARLGEMVIPEGMTPGTLTLDPDGNIFIATWDRGIVQLAPNGMLLARGGAVASPDTIPEAGQFSLPNGIAVDPQGVIWISDNSGEYSAITAMQLVVDPEARAAAESAAETATEPGAESDAEPAAATPIPEDELLRQWATRATASSAYDGYEADNATGPPDVEGCQNSTNAWAAAAPDTLETLELRFDTPVFATEVNIYQSHQPGFITNVQLIDDQGKLTSVYRAQAELQAECPSVLQVSLDRTAQPIVGVKLTIDQRGDINWSEIDAVELVGMP